MNEFKLKQHESILLRVLWMVLFVLVWQVAETVLAVVVLAQLVYRLFNGAPSLGMMSFGDSLSQYLAQIGRFGTFNTDQKPWPFADWPTPRAPDGETPYTVPVTPYASPVTPASTPAHTPTPTPTPEPSPEPSPEPELAAPPAVAPTPPTAPTPPAKRDEEPKL
ncbi:DUF4389 domain-containing protein [Pseudomonas lutea]|uniref:DUF4389 domain-containing protein n=1 Tax=Pseudomonas lutea TaxID=243924 RepID=A0ABR9A4V9_9PSED|nr:DUF4389 domain-containing protein [Pseudomonas lutea]